MLKEPRKKRKPPRKTEKKPEFTRVYRYGCKITDGAPIAYEQMRAGHKYRNELVAIERERREKAMLIMHSVAPHVEKLQVEIEQIKELIGSKEDELKALRQKDRRRTSSKELSAELATLRKRKKELIDEYKPKKDAAYESKAYKTASADMEEEDKEARLAARKATTAYWGTYGIIEQSTKKIRKGAPPQFHPWRGDGSIGVQMQRVMTPASAFGGKDDRAVLTPDPDGKHLIIRLRLKDRGGKVYVTCRARYHRPLPEGVRIRWIKLVCRRVATHDKWSVQFTLSRPTPWPKRRGFGTLAVNLGWRKLPNGDVRALSWLDDAGERGELILPKEQVGRLSKSESLQSIRDRNMDTVKLQLSSWLKTAENLPDWIQERLKTLSAWRSQARLASVVLFWRKNRFEGDEKLFDEAEAWRKQDKHLYEWQANNRRKYQAWRRDLYRNFAAKMTDRYDLLLLANVKFKQIQDKPKPEEETDEMRVARERKSITAPYELQQTLANGFHEVQKFDPKNLTAKHHGCGKLSQTSDPASVTHHCEHCGETYDQDHNHCQNLLAELSKAAVAA